MAVEIAMKFASDPSISCRKVVLDAVFFGGGVTRKRVLQTEILLCGQMIVESVIFWPHFLFLHAYVTCGQYVMHFFLRLVCVLC